MEDQELHELLEKLHNEIEHTEAVDEKGLELLEHVEKDLRDLLERSEERLGKPGLMTLQRLEDSISHLEVTHPSLTATLSQLLEILSKAGI